MFRRLSLLLGVALALTSCFSENYSNGERIGLITKFAKSGYWWKTHEGHLNVTQTGMNSADGFDFSIDRDHEDPKVIATIDSAAQYNWKVKLVYHETIGYNWFGNRGATDHFITDVVVLNKDMNINLGENGTDKVQVTGKATKDTVYMIIVNPEALRK